MNLATYRSQYKRGELWSSARYNSNNAWYFNGNNGQLNNNNLYNGLSCRPLDYNIQDYIDDEKFLSFLSELYDAYYTCRRTKRSKTSHLAFEYNTASLLIPLAISVYEHEYVPMESIVFIVTEPKIREVIAAWFGDRIIQTWYSMLLKPYIEDDWLEDDSYSCRVGKGGLRAALKLKEYIFEESNGFTEDLIIVKRDIKSFFMNIDPEIVENSLNDFIWEHFDLGLEEKRDDLCYLTRIIYRSTPQDHCIIRGNPHSLDLVPPDKSLRGRYKGLPIGNRTSQDAANFITTYYLRMIREKGYKYVHYTDDTVILVKKKDWERWQLDEKEIEAYISENLHMEWHAKKKYTQHYSKGVEFIGFKIRFDRMLPSDRIAHNFIWKCKCFARKANESVSWMYVNVDKIMQTFNSYMGLLKHCNSWRLMKEGMDIIRGSRLKEVYDFFEGQKIKVKKNKTRLSHYIYVERQRVSSERKRTEEKSTNITDNKENKNNAQNI